MYVLTYVFIPDFPMFPLVIDLNKTPVLMFRTKHLKDGTCVDIVNSKCFIREW